VGDVLSTHMCVHDNDMHAIDVTSRHVCAVTQVRADFYHAGQGKTERRSVQGAWISGRVQVVCATIAYGKTQYDTPSLKQNKNLTTITFSYPPLIGHFGTHRLTPLHCPSVRSVGWARG